MRRMVAFLPVLIVCAFPLLYYGGQLASELLSGLGLILLVTGMAGPVIRRIIGKKNEER